MPSYKEIIEEINSANPHDVVRRGYLKRYAEKVDRSVILYYSGWLLAAGQRAQDLSVAFGINDNDKNGFMAAIHGLDRTKGLDLFLHTPGGSVAATESIIRYLRDMFGTNIRAVVPQIAMSGGTLIACACESITMGKHSCLGPTDPQIGGVPAQGIVDEFKRAKKSISEDPTTIPLWQPILAKYSPALVGSCERVIEWADEICLEMLKTGMFKGQEDAEKKAKQVCDSLGRHAYAKAHDRHLHADRCKEVGLKVDLLEDDKDQEIQDLVLSIHHATLATIDASNSLKFIENNLGNTFRQQIQLKPQ